MLPLLIITASYTTVACRLWRHNAIGDTTTAQYTAQRKKRRRTLTMLLLVVGVFAICWFPLNCYVVLLSSHIIQSSNALYFCFHWLAISSTCYNPFIYCCLNPTFRQELRLLFDMCWRKNAVIKLEPDLRPVAACSPCQRVAWPDTHESSRPRCVLSQSGNSFSKQSQASVPLQQGCARALHCWACPHRQNWHTLSGAHHCRKLTQYWHDETRCCLLGFWAWCSLQARALLFCYPTNQN